MKKIVNAEELLDISRWKSKEYAVSVFMGTDGDYHPEEANIYCPSTFIGNMIHLYINAQVSEDVIKAMILSPKGISFASPGSLSSLIEFYKNTQARKEEVLDLIKFILDECYSPENIRKLAEESEILVKFVYEAMEIVANPESVQRTRPKKGLSNTLRRGPRHNWL